MDANRISGNIADRLFDLIKDSGKSQAIIAKETGLPPSLFSDLLNPKPDKARNIGIIYLVRLCEYFKVTPDYLLGFTDVKSPNITFKEINQITGLSQNAISWLSVGKAVDDLRLANLTNFLLSKSQRNTTIDLIDLLMNLKKSQKSTEVCYANDNFGYNGSYVIDQTDIYAFLVNHKLDELVDAYILDK